jgi:hypothetical protein
MAEPRSRSGLFRLFVLLQWAFTSLEVPWTTRQLNALSTTLALFQIQLHGLMLLVDRQPLAPFEMTVSG